VKKYQIIYADPPWAYRNWSDKWHKDCPESRWVGNKYHTMKPEDICNLNIESIASDDCILFLWSTPPTIENAFKVINAWGFKYKTKGFCWVKKNKVADSFFWGMGYWTRSNTEDCLIATKGNPKRLSKSIHQVIYTPIGKHSRKPDEARDRIVKLCGDLPRIELFARQKTEGWDAWGNEVESDIEISGVTKTT